jgi:D-amino-acid oxidase
VSAVDAIVVCAGLGARTLGAVEDRDVFPVRGQIILLHAPWVRSGTTASHAANGLWTYVIPRRSGQVGYFHCSDSDRMMLIMPQVVVGGTKVDNDWWVS